MFNACNQPKATERMSRQVANQSIALLIIQSSCLSPEDLPVPRPSGSAASPTFSSSIWGSPWSLLDTLQQRTHARMRTRIQKNAHARVHTHTDTHAHAHTHSRTQRHTHRHIRKHTCTHTHIQRHTQTHHHHQLEHEHKQLKNHSTDTN